MKNVITIYARVFPVVIRDRRSGKEALDMLALDKAQLQAAQVVGMSSKELIHAIYGRQGFAVREIGKPSKWPLQVDITELYQQQFNGKVGQPDCE